MSSTGFGSAPGCGPDHITTARTAAAAAAPAGTNRLQRRRTGCSGLASAAWRACVRRDCVRPSSRAVLSSSNSRVLSSKSWLIVEYLDHVAQPRAQCFQRAEIMRLHAALGTAHGPRRLADVESLEIPQQEGLLLPRRQRGD